jgi:hypothetical protein
MRIVEKDRWAFIVGGCGLDHLFSPTMVSEADDDLTVLVCDYVGDGRDR